jgi:hypothetical protein
VRTLTLQVAFEAAARKRRMVASRLLRWQSTGQQKSPAIRPGFFRMS